MAIRMLNAPAELGREDFASHSSLPSRHHAIQEWLGHCNVQHTTRYIELTSKRFRDLWQQED